MKGWYTMDTTPFQTWRVALYATMTRQAAVLMNIVDALISAPRLQRAIDLTLTPAFVRQWPSFYQGLQQGHLDRTALRALYAAHVPYLAAQRLVLALDTSSILRPQSLTARDRMAVHAANLPAGSKPVGIGWQFSLLVATPETPSCWTYVLDVTRVRAGTTAARLGAKQVAAVRPWLPSRPLVLGDRYYGSATFVLDPCLQDCDKLVRLQTHRVFYRPPAPRTEHSRGRPPKKGPRFQPKNPATHGEPTATWTGTDTHGRAVTVRAWAHLLFPDDLTHPVTVLECARQDGPNTKRDPRVIWLLWDSATEDAPLAEIPTLYSRRFSIEHGLRFDKQVLRWAEPRLRTRAFERWTDLVMAAHNSLQVARTLGETVRCPWQQGTPCTPLHVRQALAKILPTLGTPASTPQPRGKSPGRARDFHPTPAKRYPIIRKHPAKPGKPPAHPP